MREGFLHSLLRHDVRNRSHIVQGYLELLKDFDLPEEARDYLDKAIKSVLETAEIIEKVTALREAEREETSAVKINPIVEKAVEESRPYAQEKGMETEMVCSDIDIELWGGTLLTELFTNLIDNSIRHSKGSRIRISDRKTDDEVVYTIEDDGIGIERDLRDGIFDRGFKNGDTGGSGLGLFLVKRIVESYGGDVEVMDSDLGGARFEVRMKRV